MHKVCPSSGSMSFVCAHAKSIYKLYHLIIGPPVDFKTWCKRQAETHPQFKYWSNVFDLELLVLEFVRSLRDRDFDMYLQTFDQLAPWMFALDHNHYARWLPVHIRDVKGQASTNPQGVSGWKVCGSEIQTCIFSHCLESKS